MKYVTCLLVYLFWGTLNAQSLSVSPIIDRSIFDNQVIIAALDSFLQTKNQNAAANPYWLQSDFERYIYPYADILGIESSRFGDDFYKPTLMEILDTKLEHQKILKIGFVGYQSTTGERHLKGIFNVISNKVNGKIQFSKYLTYTTQHWKQYRKGSLHYWVSPQRKVNVREVNQQLNEIKRLCAFFGCAELPITYYSCVNPKELFEIKGFDYTHSMYVSERGGLAEAGNLVFSGNNSERYTHEIVHIYTHQLYPGLLSFLDEGIATYLAGSGGFEYDWHRKVFKQYLSENPEFQLSEHLSPYEYLYIQQETPAPYIIGALVCERTIRLYGKEKLLSLLASKLELWPTLELVGLNRQNFDDELRKELLLRSQN